MLTRSVPYTRSHWPLVGLVAVSCVLTVGYLGIVAMAIGAG